MGKSLACFNNATIKFQESSAKDGIDQAEVFESEPIPEETEENQKEMEDETEAGESGVDQS